MRNRNAATTIESYDRAVRMWIDAVLTVLENHRPSVEVPDDLRMRWIDRIKLAIREVNDIRTYLSMLDDYVYKSTDQELWGIFLKKLRLLE